MDKKMDRILTMQGPGDTPEREGTICLRTRTQTDQTYCIEQTAKTGLSHKVPIEDEENEARNLRKLSKKEKDRERDETLKQLFGSKDSDAHGRLKILDSKNMADIMGCCGTSKIKSGGFGDIFSCKFYFRSY